MVNILEFGSEEYLKKVMELSNNDEEFKKLASDQNTTYTFVFEPEPENGVNEKIAIGYKIEGGIIQEVWRGEKETEFVISGKYGVWVDIITGKLSPVKALITRKLKVKGNKFKLMKYTKATNRWIEILKTIPTEFHGKYKVASFK